MTFNIIIRHIFPENFIEVPQVVQKLLRTSLSILAIFIDFYKHTQRYFNVSTPSSPSDRTAPYFLLGHKIFPLKKWLMRPYPGLNADEEERVYNYRHSRGRRVIENAFSILASRWTIFHKPIRAMVSNVEKYTMACLTLHNYLRQTENAFYPPSGFIDSENDCRIIIPGSWRSDIDGNRLGGALQNLRSFRGSGYCVDAIS